MLKSYNELRKIDVLPFCDTREAKDDKGRKIQIPYLSWARCAELLHENGATEVWFDPVEDTNGSLVWSSAHTENKDGRKCGNYFVKVKIHIDDKEFMQTYPLMNGANIVYEDTLNQLRISNAHARAFVKGVAIRTGLGFGLWLNEKDTEPTVGKEELSEHNPLKVREYIEQLMTEKIRRGISEDDVLSSIGINRKQFDLVQKALSNAYPIIAELRK